jgi:hypothetical protein
MALAFLDPGAQRRHSRYWLKLLIGIGGMLLMFGNIALALFWREEEPPKSRFVRHSDQIAADLRAHGLSIAHVYINDGIPGKPGPDPYQANLAVHAPLATGSTPVQGRVVCRIAKRRCWYQISALGIGPRNLPDLADPAPQVSESPAWQTMLRNAMVWMGIAEKVR